MAGALSCPKCGEADRLVGRPDRSAGGPDGILVRCLACGHSWPRGVRPCVSCGGTDVVDRPQTMTRTPRGNQLAVIGTRTIRLCTRCDADALQASLAHNQSVPDGYAARYRHEGDTSERTGARARRAEPGSRQPGGKGRDAPSWPPAAEPAPAPHSDAASKDGRAAPSRPRARRRGAPAPPAAPLTLRQAVAQSLEAGVDADPTVVVLLGARLGASTRLGELDDPQVWAGVWGWVAATWPDPDRGTGARQTISGLLEHWREQGWVTRVPSDAP